MPTSVHNRKPRQQVAGVTTWQTVGSINVSEEAPRHRVSSRSRRILKRVGIGALAVAMVLSLAAVLYIRHLNGNINQVAIDDSDGRPDVVQVAGGRPLNVLVMGSDTREGANGVGIGGETPGLSDTTMLLHMSANRKFAYGISLPRDAIVDRPRCRKEDGSFAPAAPASMFNAAYAVAGPSCTVKTVEQLTNIRIDHFLVVDFVGFRSMVNALGGVTICVPEAVNDDVGKISLPKGTYNASGQQALDYVRVRHDIGAPTGDVGRMKRQQSFVSAMIKKVVSAGTLANPFRLTSFLEAATESLTADQGVDVKMLANIGNQLKNIGLDKIQFITVPVEAYPLNPTVSLQWTSEADALWELVRQDKRLGARFDGDAVSPGEGSSPGSEATAAPSNSPSSSPSGSPGSPATADEVAEQERRDAAARAAGLCTSSN